MSDEFRLAADLIAAYRRRGAPAGFARRVAARTAGRRAGHPIGWRVPALAALVILLAVLVPVGLRERPAQAPDGVGEELPSLPPFPSMMVDEGEISLPGLSSIGEVPYFPARPSLDMDALPDARLRHDDRRGDARGIAFAPISEENTDDRT